LRLYRAVHPDITSGQIAMLLEVARDPGLGPSEYGRRLGCDQASASRDLSILGVKARSNKRGLDLVESVRDLMDRRQLHYHLTPKGRALIESILDLYHQRATD
jgi:DNA-binding MarR family transcriptional regulator